MMISYTNFNFMMSRLVTFLILAFLTMQGYAQSVPPAYEIKNDTLWQQDVPDAHVLFILDSTGKIMLEEARAAVNQGKLKPWKKAFTKTGLTQGEYWFYYRLTNKTGKPIETGFDAYSNKADFHVIRQNNKHEVYTTGDGISWKKKKEFWGSNIAPVSIGKDETIEVFYHASLINSRFTNSIKIAIVNPDRYARKYLAENEQQLVRKEEQTRAFYSGIFLVAALIYFVFFFLVREKVFLYFACFLLFLYLTSTHFNTTLFRNYPDMIVLNGLSGLISFTFFLHFIRQYLDTKKHLPRWDKFLIAFSFLFLIIGAADITFSTNSESRILFSFLALFVICLIATFFMLKNQQATEKKFLLYAVLPFLLVFPLLLVFILWVVFTRDQSIFTNNKILDWIAGSLSTLMDLSYIWMIISFSRLLFRRFTEQRQKISDQEKEKEQILLEQEQEKLRLIEKQKIDLEQQVTARTAELKQSLENLKATQAQLIQSEKMASLGEMTAGIAHEIQNPLNFVNNFAEVNNEITSEIKAEIEKMIPEDKRGDLNTLLDDLAGNQEKIQFHGKRADSIVKNMLLHSRKGTLQKEPVNLNALIDEYTKLSYHGLRARDKSFNSDFDIQLDPSINTVELLQQDFGRVILNLVNNAFYAVHEKTKTCGSDYNPKVVVKTRRIENSVRIEVNDNGSGISEQIKEKIFQPFFTTKPTGEGTGLGLSISYEIITKGHNGKMWVESKEGEGTSFIVEIPA
jgi:signal transduction histidine kinase